MTHELNLDEYVFPINSLELASDLAHERLMRDHAKEIEDGSLVVFVEDEEDSTRYTDDAQDIFNDYYDWYLTIIESSKVTLEIKN